VTTTTTASFRLRAITDESITKTHLGAVEKANRTWCGVDLLVKNDPRFGGKYSKGNGYSSTTDLSTVDCKACLRTAAWKGQQGGKYVVPAARPKAAPKAAAEAVSGSGAVIEADPGTGLPRIRPEVAAKADAIVAAQLTRNAEAGK
jgi:hypothetical protein